MSALTIVIPTYNRAGKLPRALDSVLAQTRADFEVHISDNASTDDTPAVCEEYARRDPRVRFTRQPENLGPLGNFNFLLAEVTTPYLLMLADDDWLDDTYVERCIAIIEADPTLAIVSAATNYYDDGRVEIDRPERVLNTEVLGDKAGRRVTTYLSTSWSSSAFYGLMRTNQVRKAIPIPNVMGADWLFVSALAFQGRIVTTTDTHLNRERGGASVSFEQIAKTAGLSKRSATYPMTAIMYHQCRDIISGSAAFQTLSLPRRVLLGLASIVAIARSQGINILWEPIAPIAMSRPFVWIVGPLKERWVRRRQG